MNASKKKFFINLFAAVALVFLFLSYGMRYFISGIEDSSAKIVADKKAIVDISAKNAKLADSREKYEEIKETAEDAFAVILDKGSTVDFITQAEKDAQESNVKLKINTVGEKTAKQDNSFISSADFQFTAGGDFNGLMHFLYNLENFKYDLDISNVKISRGDFDQYNKGILVMNFNVKLYQKNSQ